MFSKGIETDIGRFFKCRAVRSVTYWTFLMLLLGSSAPCQSDYEIAPNIWRYAMQDSDYGMSSIQWSVDGSHLVLSFGPPAGREIYAVRSDGSSLSRISPRTGQYETNLTPDISPDGSRLVYVTSKFSSPPSSEIKIARLDGSTQSSVTENIDVNSGPAWSPDGTRIAFAKIVDRDSSNVAGIYTVAPDGAQERLITPPSMLLDPTSSYEWGPVWSPDGSAIAFAVRELQAVSEDWEYPNNPVAGSLYKAEADGSGLKLLFTDLEEEYSEVDIKNLTWSPDGRRIVFSYTTTTPTTLNDEIRLVRETKLYIVGRDSDGLREIPGTSELVSGGYCSKNICTSSLEWSPDGDEILLSSVPGTYSIRVEDFEIRKITEGSGYATWSPDGFRIALYNVAHGDSALVSMQKDGSDVRVLARINEDGRLAPGNPG